MTRAEWMARVCGDLGTVLASLDREPLTAGQALALAKSGACWLLDDATDRTLGEAMGLAALLVVMVRETCIENEQKRAEEKAS